MFSDKTSLPRAPYLASRSWQTSACRDTVVSDLLLLHYDGPDLRRARSSGAVRRNKRFRCCRGRRRSSDRVFGSASRTVSWQQIGWGRSWSVLASHDRWMIQRNVLIFWEIAKQLSLDSWRFVGFSGLEKKRFRWKHVLPSRFFLIRSDQGCAHSAGCSTNSRYNNRHCDTDTCDVTLGSCDTDTCGVTLINFETLIGTICIPLSADENLHRIF